MSQIKQDIACALSIGLPHTGHIHTFGTIKYEESTVFGRKYLTIYGFAPENLSDLKTVIDMLTREHKLRHVYNIEKHAVNYNSKITAIAHSDKCTCRKKGEVKND
ncbi:MAG: hypothetical protein QXV17_06800 [Candidatus Micrarchaeaceae archaeon]